MKKLIVKSHLSDRKVLDKKLKAIGQKFSPVIWQHERVYLPHNYKPNSNLPRLVIRTEVKTTKEPASYYFYLKRHIEDSGVDWVNFARINDYAEIAGIIHQLGFKKVAEVSRQRQELALDNQTVIYLDTIEGLDGQFLKIEAELNDGDSVDALRVDLLKILDMLGQTTFMMQTYFDLISGDESEEFVVESE